MFVLADVLADRSRGEVQLAMKVHKSEKKEVRSLGAKVINIYPDCLYIVFCFHEGYYKYFTLRIDQKFISLIISSQFFSSFTLGKLCDLQNR